MGDLLITGGLVVDGTGGAANTLDIRIRDGRITEMAAGLRPDGEEVIDAEGAIVAPGFIDSHTHYDATVYWDPMCDPMPQHGVTSVVAGNCALSLAPLRAQDRASLVDVYSFIEDMPGEVLSEAIPWSWEGYADYAKAMSRQRLGINLLTFVGHSQIRSYVMGEAAWERAATPAEIEAMTAELEQALAAGALGLSYSLFDKDRQGRLVPSAHADQAEMDALFEVLAARRAPFQFVPCGDTTDILIEQLEWLGQFLARHGVVGLYNVVVHLDSEPERSRRIIACLEKLHAKGARMFGMATPRPFELSIGFEQSLCFMAVPAWNELVQAPIEARRRMLDDPQWRARARSDADTYPSILFPFDKPELLRIGSVGKPGLQSWIGQSLRDLAETSNGHASDALADWLKDSDFETTFVFPIANTNEAEVAKILKHPLTFVSASDAGAHLQMFCAAGDSTLLLTRYVRERGDFSLEEAVHSLTGRQASILDLMDRGVLAPGKAADITIFALDELTYGPQVLVNDLPGGRPRLTRDPGGYRYTIINGVVVQRAGKATGALPARWLARAA